MLVIKRDAAGPDASIVFDHVSFHYPAASEVSLASLESIALPVAERTDAPLARFGAGVWGYPFDPSPGVPNPTQHVLYRGVDSHIHELWWDSTGWNHNDLHGVPGTPLASGDPTGFAHTGKGTQHVFFVSDANHVIALQWRP